MTDGGIRIICHKNDGDAKTQLNDITVMHENQIDHMLEKKYDLLLHIICFMVSYLF